MPSAPVGPSLGTPGTPLRRHLVVCSSFRPSGGQSRLIIPGGRSGSDSSSSRNNNKQLFNPADRQHAADRPKIELGDTSTVPVPSKFRPPPGFMDKKLDLGAAAPQEPSVAPEKMLDQLRTRAGTWHELAPLIPRLTAAGYDMPTIEAATELERSTQSVWAVAVQVHQSLRGAEGISERQLAYFDEPEGAGMLYHMRMLPVSARPVTAAYVADKALNLTEAQVLARAVKEQERRQGRKEGFSSLPADCLAYKYYRDAVEMRNATEKARLVARGLSVAATEDARAALEALSASPIPGKEEVLGTKLQILNMSGEEIDFRPVPLLEDLATLTPENVAAAQSVRQTGPFNAFGLPPGAGGASYVALPAWTALSIARSPVAVTVADCRSVPAIMRSSQAKKKEELKRLAGPGLLLLERHLDGEETHDATAYYVIAGPDGNLDLVEGGKVAAGQAVCGRVPFYSFPG